MLPKEEVVSDSCVFADLDLPSLPAKQPEPESNFELTLTHDGDVHGFISWFDKFFFPSATVPAVHPRSVRSSRWTRRTLRVWSSRECHTQARDGGKGELVSFSTSPYSTETHWQQTLFVLKDPITGVKKGDRIKGRIVVLQDQKHSRQLEVELHYSTSASRQRAGGKEEVETQLVQVFMVR